MVQGFMVGDSTFLILLQLMKYVFSPGRVTLLSGLLFLQLDFDTECVIQYSLRKQPSTCSVLNPFPYCTTVVSLYLR